MGVAIASTLILNNIKSIVNKLISNNIFTQLFILANAALPLPYNRYELCIIKCNA